MVMFMPNTLTTSVAMDSMMPIYSSWFCLLSNMMLM
jgi:hypothetical protein